MNTRQPLLVERRMRFMPCTVEPSDSVAHARALLDERRIKHLPVVFMERLVGIVSAHNLRACDVSRTHPKLAKALEMNPDRVRVNSVMTIDVRTVKPSDNLGYAAQLMQRNHIGVLPVLEQGRLAGIISRTDLRDSSFATGMKRKTPMTKRARHISAREVKVARRLLQSVRVPNALWSRELRRSHDSRPGY
jgi:CBS-domain-containing membrane protein